MECEVINKFKELFEVNPQSIAKSPGRVDLMGSHTDYNHGYVVTMPVDLQIECAFSASEGNTIHLYSCNLNDGVKIDITTGDQTEGGNWGKYISAVVKVLIDEGYELKAFNGAFDSGIPIGSGLSSSAALEAAAMAIIANVSGFTIDSKSMALLCQRAENVYVGVNCGILDQYSVIFGEEHKVIKLDCRELTHSQVSWPEELMIAICNTNKPRELHGSEYDDRRAQCEEAAAVFAKHDSKVKALRDVDIETFHKFKKELSENAAKRAEFIIEENDRTHELEAALSNKDLEKLDDIMDRSFQGAKDLFEISVPHMEYMYKAMKSAPGVVGARQAGAGFGGCMVAFIYKDQLQAFKESVFNTYKALCGIDCIVYGVHTAEGTNIKSI